MEAIVAKVNDLKDGEMKEVKVGETVVLLTRIQGKCHAIGGVCTHYGGHLAEGTMKGERVYCPWHLSAFNVASGDLLEPPALDAVPRFAVRVEGNNVMVEVPEGAGDRRVPDMVRPDPATDKRTFIILGAGGAGLAAAETLRQDGFQGRIVMITQETRLPYDRPNVSKGYLQGADPEESLYFRDKDFYKEHGIEVFLGKKVKEVDAAAKSLTLADGATLAYDGLLLATGGAARRLEAPGGELKNVFTLRNPDDANAIMDAAQNAKRAVIVGASFIGMETAGSLAKRGLKVDVVAGGPVPYHKTLGPEIGKMWQKVLEDNGVTFHLGARVAHFEGHGRVQAAVLDNGQRLEADLVIEGVGVSPATGILKGVPLNPDGSVTVDSCLKAADGLYAAGDVARFPDWRTGEPIRIEHWRLAMQQGRCAAHNLAGRKTEFKGVPFFWTERLDVFFQYVGFASGWDEIIYHGSVTDQNFMAFYVKGGRVLAVSAMNHEKQMTAVAELMRLDALPGPDELRRDTKFDPVQRLANVK